MTYISTKQLLLLNNLMYIPYEYEPFIDLSLYKGCRLADVCNQIVENDVWEEIPELVFGDDLIEGSDWMKIIQFIRSDSRLKDVIIVEYDQYSEAIGGARALFYDETSGEGIVVFKGTESHEWKDNFEGGYMSDTKQQIAALKWFKSLDLNGYSYITVTGHSKGGNKAKYITVVEDDRRYRKRRAIDRCIAFDSQGFSEAFCSKYVVNIAERLYKIENCNLYDDYVNILLNPLSKGEKVKYYEHRGEFGESSLKNHAPCEFFNYATRAGGIKVTRKQQECIRRVGDFLNCFFNDGLTLSQKRVLCNALARVCEQVKCFDISRILLALCSPDLKPHDRLSPKKEFFKQILAAPVNLIKNTKSIIGVMRAFWRFTAEYYCDGNSEHSMIFDDLEEIVNIIPSKYCNVSKILKIVLKIMKGCFNIKRVLGNIGDKIKRGVKRIGRVMTALGTKLKELLKRTVSNLRVTKFWRFSFAT